MIYTKPININVDKTQYMNSGINTNINININMDRNKDI